MKIRARLRKMLKLSAATSRVENSGKLIRSGERGLTLVEIIVVLVILAVLMSWLGGKLFSMGASAKADVTRLKLQGLKQNIYLYQMRNNQLPQDLKSAGASDADLNDAWGNPVQYRALDGNRSYELKSLGADGRDGGSGADEDITLKGP